MTWLLKLVGGISDNPMLLIWLVAGAFGLGALTSAVPVWKYQGARLGAVKAEYKGFVAQTKAAGEAAAKKALLQKKNDERRKEQSDAENKRTHDANMDVVRRLRNERANSSFVPSTATCAGSPEAACFDRAKLESAIRVLDSEVSGIVDKGSNATIDLNTAKIWAKP